MSIIEISVDGTARPQGSKTHVGNGIMIESSKHVANWRNWVRLQACEVMRLNQHAMLNGPVQISVTFYMDRPKSHSTTKGLRPTAPTYHTGKPDIDKLLRAILDALTGVCFRDDSQIAIVSCEKNYATAASTEIYIFDLEKPNVCN
jgi:crossover junction endodeoxyribonuclease RusA